MVLDLSWNEAVEEDSVCKVLERSPRLEMLKLRACETIGARVVTPAAMHCPTFTRLTWPGATTLSDAAIGSGSKLPPAARCQRGMVRLRRLRSIKSAENVQRADPPERFGLQDRLEGGD